MILHDNLEKFRWIFANAFRKYLYGNEERYYTKSGIILMKHELDSGHVAIYQTSSNDTTYTVGEHLTLIGVYFKEQNAFVYGSSSVMLPSEFIIRDKARMQKYSRCSEYTASLRFMEDHRRQNSFKVLDKNFKADVGSMYITLLAQVITKWVPDEYNDEAEQQAELLFKNGHVVLSEYEMLSEIMRHVIVQELEHDVKDDILCRIANDEPNLVNSYINGERDLTSKLVFSCCSSKNKNAWLAEYSKTHEPTRDIRILQVLYRAHLAKKKKVNITFSFGLRAVEESIGTDITRDSTMFSYYYKNHQFTTENRQVTRMRGYDTSFQYYLPFITQVRVGKEVLFSEPTEITEEERILNHLWYLVNNCGSEDVLQFITGADINLNYITSYDESILGLLVQSCIYKHGYEEVFETLAAKCTLTKDTKVLLRNSKSLSYSSTVKEYLKVFDVELDEEDEPYCEDYEDYEEMEDYEEYEEDKEF